VYFSTTWIDYTLAMRRTLEQKGVSDDVGYFAKFKEEMDKRMRPWKKW